MFWDNWIPASYKVKKDVCAVEILLRDEGPVYRYAVYRIKKNRLEQSECGESGHSLQLPKHLVKNKLPLVLVISGKGILTRKLTPEAHELENPQALATKYLTAINPGEFHTQFFPQDSGDVFAGFCRHDLAMQCVQEAAALKLDIAAVYVGVGVITAIKQLWGAYNHLLLGAAVAELNGSSLSAILPGTPDTKVQAFRFQDLEVPGTHLCGFAAAFAYLTQHSPCIQEKSALTEMWEQHVQKNTLRFATVVIVGLAFAIALTNVVFYSSYFDRHNRVDSELAVYQGKYEKINQLLTKYQKNKSLIENAGVLDKNRLSEFADRIGATIPNEVVLSDLYFNPKKETDENADSLVGFQPRQIIIKGNCEKSLVINEWVNVLKLQKFVSDVSLERFTYGRESLLPNFEIHLFTKQ